MAGGTVCSDALPAKKERATPRAKMEHEHPASMTARAVKKALPDRAIVTKDARMVLNTATSMFTLYLSAIAHDISTKNKRSTITLKDVMAALQETEFEQFIEPIEQCLQDTKAMEARKRARKEATKSDAAAAERGEAEPMIDGPVDAEAATVEELPIETDADLEGEQTINEDEDDAEEGEDEEQSADEEVGATEDAPSNTIEKPRATKQDAVDEETKAGSA